MPLNLTVPALEDKPLIPAETRPQKILEFLAKLPTSPLEAATALHDEMEILNRQKVSADSRFKALEVYRGHTITLVSNLSHTYCTASLPLSKEAQAYAAAAESLWLELAYGYKLTLNDQLSQLFNPSDRTTVTIHRAMDSLHQLSMVYYETYFNVPGTVWRDLHQLYFHAAHESLHEIALQKDGQPTSIDLLYKQILLMSLADPQHMAPQDIELVADYIERFAIHTQLQGLGTPENPAGIFIIHLDSDTPPVPYVRSIKQTNADTDIFFITVELARLAHQNLQMLQSGNVSKNSGLPESMLDNKYQDMLVYLIKHWGASPKRIYKRLSKNSISQLGIGLSAAHFFINNEQFYQQPAVIDESGFQGNEATNSSVNKLPIKPTNWQMLNISASGTALRKFPNIQAQVRIGELLSIKNEGEKNWSVAVLRWASNGEQNQLDIGTQLLAPNAKAAGTRIVNNGDFEPALILPAIPSINQEASLIARSGFYAPARVLELDENGTISRIMITRLVERTRSFERFQFSIL
ncbi:MAG: hypothetical protein CVU35_06040 [Betaproteobacteria bacterium HGW-Betaproteobacteria-8]|nr:MAG: hypothetical protein CVU35_06040 [Betaproteobacteria bacterium HGW-Betaproteobacteria-8]